MKGNEVLLPFSSELITLEQFDEYINDYIEFPLESYDEDITFIYKYQPFQSIWYDLSKNIVDNHSKACSNVRRQKAQTNQCGYFQV